MHSIVISALALALWPQAATAGRHRDLIDARNARYEKPAQDMYNSYEKRSTTYQFMNNNTKPYAIESLPDVNFDIGELYSGSVPIDSNDTSRTLFFVFAPTIGDPVDEVTIWLNGGPGCSSLEGFFQENGPITWQPGTLAPVRNPYSWVNLTNMLWVDQPVGTGYTTGNATATSQYETAQDFVKFFKNWEEIFGITNYKIYVTGESYAGRYVPYISAAMLDQNDTEYYNLSGALVYDPCIGDFNAIQEEYVTYPFLAENNNILNLNDSFMQELESLHQSCGYAEYIDKYLTFPASGVQPPVYFNLSEANYSACDVFDLANDALLVVNPCFDIYEIVAMCPIPSNVLGFPTELVYDMYNQTYFNRSDVKAAMHAPTDSDWAECKGPVFLGGPEVNGSYTGGPQGEGDLAPDPIQHVLPQVIEATNRVLVGNGDFDMIIITNGTLMAIQNMTWNGQLGFQERPNTPINIEIPDIVYAQVFAENDLSSLTGAQGVMGIQHYERGLMWVETYQSGHMQPEFQPRASYRHLSWLLGRTDTI